MEKAKQNKCTIKKGAGNYHYWQRLGAQQLPMEDDELQILSQVSRQH